jgi:ankyrin repeat protein
VAAPGDLRLIDAVKKSDAKSVRSLLVEHADVNATDVDGSTALLWAAQRNNTEIVDILLASGANVKAATRYNVTPLSMAA